MRNITFGVFIIIFIMFTGCTIKTKTTKRQAQPQPQYQYQPPRTTRLYFQYKHIENEPYIITPTALPLNNPKPKKLR